MDLHTVKWAQWDKIQSKTTTAKTNITKNVTKIGYTQWTLSRATATMKANS